MEIGQIVGHSVNNRISNLVWKSVRESVRSSIDDRLFELCMGIMWEPIEDMLLPINSFPKD